MSVITPEPDSVESNSVDEQVSAGRTKRTLQIIAVLAVLASLGVVIWSAVTTSSARVTATTEGSSFFSASTIDIFQPNLAVDLLFDADGLFPGRATSGCVELEYQGSIASSVRLHAERAGGTGLEDFIDLRISTLAADECPAGDQTLGETPPLGEPVFIGSLTDLEIDHPSYSSGVVLADEMEPGDRLALFAVAEVVDDNEAQGLTTLFNITVEARP